MWKTLVCLMVLVTVWQGVAGAEGDGVLSGYLVLEGDNKCLNTAGTGVATITSTTESALAANCIRLYLVEGSETQNYRIQKLGDQSMRLKLADNMTPTFVSPGSETEVQFSDGGLIPAVTASSVASITTANSAFFIQLSTATASNPECLTATPRYVTGDCGLIRWYFIKIDCEVEDCATCVDATICESCTDGTHVLNDANGCDDCGTAIEGCTTCSDTSGMSVCSACEATKRLNSGSSCVDCTVDNCDNCDSDLATCDICASGYNKQGDTCEDCATPIDDCTTCTDTTGTSICSACHATKTPNSDGTACVDCTVDNCDNCDSDLAECDTCADGYDKKGDDTCEEEATTTESCGSALTTTIGLTMLAALVALKSLIYI